MESVKTFYDKNAHKANSFEEEILRNKERFPQLYALRKKEQELLKEGTNKKVFYFAGGSGSHVLELAKLKAKIVTLDFSLAMINKTCEKLTKKGIGFKVVKETSKLTEEDIDSYFKENQKNVLIIMGDIKEVELPLNYFDWTFCYCTLSLIEKHSRLQVLKKLLSISKNGVISIYNKDKLPILEKYYQEFGFKAKIKKDTISIEGGFEYQCIPSFQIKQLIKPKRSLEIIQVDLGKIYVWRAY